MGAGRRHGTAFIKSAIPRLVTALDNGLPRLTDFPASESTEAVRMRVRLRFRLRAVEANCFTVDAPIFSWIKLPHKYKTPCFVGVDVNPQGLLRACDFPGIAVVVLEWIRVTRQRNANGMQQ